MDINKLELAGLDLANLPQDLLKILERSTEAEVRDALIDVLTEQHLGQAAAELRVMADRLDKLANSRQAKDTTP